MEPQLRLGAFRGGAGDSDGPGAHSGSGSGSDGRSSYSDSSDSGYDDVTDGSDGSDTAQAALSAKRNDDQRRVDAVSVDKLRAQLKHDRMRQHLQERKNMAVVPVRAAQLLRIVPDLQI